MDKQSVYLVACGDYECCNHHGIFTRREDAERCAAMLEKVGECPNVEECVLDAALSDVIYSTVTMAESLGTESLGVDSVRQRVDAPGTRHEPLFYASTVYWLPYSGPRTLLAWEVEGDKEQAVAFVKARAEALKAAGAWGDHEALKKLAEEAHGHNA